VWLFEERNWTQNLVCLSLCYSLLHTYKNCAENYSAAKKQKNINIVFCGYDFFFTLRMPPFHILRTRKKTPILAEVWVNCIYATVIS